MPHLSRIDRVRGCLLGLAVGDALGAPLEGLSAQQIKTHYGRVKNYVDGVQAWKRKPYRWRMRGPLLRRHAAGPGALRRPARVRPGRPRSGWPSSTSAWRRPRARSSAPIGASAGASGRSSATWSGASRRGGPAR